MFLSLARRGQCLCGSPSWFTVLVTQVEVSLWLYIAFLNSLHMYFYWVLYLCLNWGMWLMVCLNWSDLKGVANSLVMFWRPLSVGNLLLPQINYNQMVIKMNNAEMFDYRYFILIFWLHFFLWANASIPKHTWISFRCVWEWMHQKVAGL